MTATEKIDGLLRRIAPHVGKKGSGKATCGEIGEAIGYNERQVWAWIVGRKQIPNGEATLRLLAWVEEREASAAATAALKKAGEP